ncbi:MAG: zinc-dependent metalloprotease family protein, partial [Bradymonadia bacterium]
MRLFESCLVFWCLLAVYACRGGTEDDCRSSDMRCEPPLECLMNDEGRFECLGGEDIGVADVQGLDSAVSLDMSTRTDRGIGDVGAHPLDVDVVPDTELIQDSDVGSYDCSADTYDHDSDPTTECVACSATCEAGATETQACSATSDRVCTPCADGTYDNDSEPTTECVACSATCEAGATETQACTATTDRVCTPCADGTYDNDSDPLTACVSCSSTCEAGATETQACSATADRVCTNCGEETFDHDEDPATACMPCTPVCENGGSEIQTCNPTTDRVCSACPPGFVLSQGGACERCESGTYDHDGLGSTECLPCTVCGSGAYEIQACTPVDDRACAPCSSNPSGVTATLIDRMNPSPGDCGLADPDCLETVDVVVFYTPAFSALLGDDASRLVAAANEVVNVSNESLNNSLIDPMLRYRLVGIELFAYEERDDLKGDLVWLRLNPHYQKMRQAYGADAGIFLLGTTGFGGLAYSNFSTGAAFIERGVLVLDGYYITPDYANCSDAVTTVGHELGHVLGAKHRASQFSATSGLAHAYHNQEPLYRRNEAYGQPVSQHGQKLYSLMSYSNYKDENNRPKACQDCAQINVLSSPELWLFFDPLDPAHGTCLMRNDGDLDHLKLQCRSLDPWTLDGDEYVPNQGTMLDISADELL